MVPISLRKRYRPGNSSRRFYLLGGLTLDGFDEALVKLGVETQHVSYVIEEPVE